MHISTSFEVWVGAFLTLALFSFLYKDNPIYKLAEHIFVGTSAGYFLALSFYQQIMDDMVKKIFPKTIWWNLPAPPDWSLIGAGVLGIMILCRLIPKVSWLSRWGIALTIGFNAGVQIYSALSAYVLSQLAATMLPLFISNIHLTRWDQILLIVKNLLIIGGVTSALCYFYFSKEHKGWFGGIAKAGIWVLMITFGAGYGATVMTRISITLGPVRFLLEKWLGVI